MADAATTGTLVVVALSGGAGALFGAVLGQVVQLHRDRKQYEREDARQERERQQALEDDRRKWREARYVNLLTAINRLDRAIAESLDAINFWLEMHREWMAEGRDVASMRGTTPWVFANRAAEFAAKSAPQLRAEHENVVRAIYEAWPIASKAAQAAYLEVVNRPVLWEGELKLRVLYDRMDGSEVYTGVEPMETPEEAEQRVADPLRELSSSTLVLADLLRDELRLD